MCGIAALFSKDIADADTSNIGPGSLGLEAKLLQMLGMIRHRGDVHHFAEKLVFNLGALGTNRLAIVDRESAKQPNTDEKSGLTIVFNGEIYNYIELSRELSDEKAQTCGEFKTESDTEVVLRAYLRWGEACLSKLDGIFAFIIYDPRNHSYFAARDHIGIKPLYCAEFDNVIAFGSERKCFIGMNCDVHEIEPGMYCKNGGRIRYHKYNATPTQWDEQAAIKQCRSLLESALERQVATDLPIAVIFSGGLDSAIILHLARKYHDNITAFSLGTENSEDLIYARRYCNEHSINHQIVEFDTDIIDRIIPRAIFEGEFFEPVDIADMLSMSLVYAAVRNHGIKIAISGDGSDEIFAGYDMFKSAVDPYELTTMRVNNLYRTDLQRVDRSSMASSVECRVPFLDKQLIGFALDLPIELKISDGVEKYILRESMRGELPNYLLNRLKIRMPEGIGINDQIFQALRKLKPKTNSKYDGGVLIDNDQVGHALNQFINFGYAPPKERIKQVGIDYHEGGYFNFSSN